MLFRSPVFGHPYLVLELTAALIAHHIPPIKNEDVMKLKIGDFIDVDIRNLQDDFEVTETTTRPQHARHVIETMRTLLNSACGHKVSTKLSHTELPEDDTDKLYLQ